MRWPVFFALTVLIGLGQMLLRIHAPADGFPWRAEWLFLVGFHCALRGRPAYAPVALWWCGLMRDIFLGERLGANAFLFLLAAAVLLVFRRRARERNPLVRIGLAFGLALALGLLRPLAESWIVGPLWSREALVAVGSAALLTALLEPVFGALLGLPILRPWREGEPAYGLPGAR